MYTDVEREVYVYTDVEREVYAYTDVERGGWEGDGRGMGGDVVSARERGIDEEDEG